MGRRIACLLLAGSVLGGVNAPAFAQTAPATSAAEPAAQDELQDIVVTAQRREERLQDVPIAVSAISGADLEGRQIGDVNALAANVPAVTFTATPYGNNDLILAIRGVAPGGVLPLSLIHI